MATPETTILADYTAEIYASRNSGDITILHNKPFQKELQSLEYLEHEKELIFVFDQGLRIPYGEPLKETLWAFFSQAQKAVVILYDKQKKAAISGIAVPVIVKQPKVNLFN